jgi:hypothetical protein
MMATRQPCCASFNAMALAHAAAGAGDNRCLIHNLFRYWTSVRDLYTA